MVSRDLLGPARGAGQESLAPALSKQPEGDVCPSPFSSFPWAWWGSFHDNELGVGKANKHVNPQNSCPLKTKNILTKQSWKQACSHLQRLVFSLRACGSTEPFFCTLSALLNLTLSLTAVLRPCLHLSCLLSCSYSFRCLIFIRGSPSATALSLLVFLRSVSDSVALLGSPSLEPSSPSPFSFC